MKKIVILFIALVFLTSCNKGKDYEVKFNSGEIYKFEELSVKVIDDEEKMTTKEIYNSLDDKDQERVEEIIKLLEKCEVVDGGYAYKSIPDHESLLLKFKNKKDEDTIYMYDTKRDRNTKKFHYTFSGSLGKYDSPAIFSDEDLISKIKNIIKE